MQDPARIHSSSPAWLVYVLWEREREAGPWRREGRSLCGQTGQSHPEGWVLRQQKRKTHLFSLLRTRWNVMVWSQKDQGGEYPRGKDQRKRLRERGKAESGSPPIASNSLVLNENMRMNLSRPCRLQRALPSARAQPAWSCGFIVAFSGPGGGTAEVNLSLYSVFEEEAECIFGDSHSGLLRLEESGLQKSELRQVFQPSTSSSSFSSSFLSQIEASSSAGKPQVVKMLPHINRSYLLLVTLGIFVMRLHLSASALDTFFYCFTHIVTSVLSDWLPGL